MFNVIFSRYSVSFGLASFAMTLTVPSNVLCLPTHPLANVVSYYVLLSYLQVLSLALREFILPEINHTLESLIK